MVLPRLIISDEVVFAVVEAVVKLSVIEPPPEVGVDEVITGVAGAPIGVTAKEVAERSEVPPEPYDSIW